MAQTKKDKISSKHVEKCLTESRGIYPLFEEICKKFTNLCNYSFQDFLTPVIPFIEYPKPDEVRASPKSS